MKVVLVKEEIIEKLREIMVITTTMKQTSLEECVGLIGKY
jgi:hypothetical protein